MKFTVSRDEFYQAVSSVQRATATRVIQPILANILFRAESGASTLTLAATDLDFSLKTGVNAQIHTPGETTIQAKKLAEILAKLPSRSMVTLDIDTTVQTARLTCGSSLFDLRTLPAEEFPPLPQFPATETLEVDLAGFLRAIRQTEFAAAGYETNNVLGGVFVRLKPDGMEMVATDGSRLARRVEVLDGTAMSQDISAIIPVRTLQEFMRIGSAAASEKPASVSTEAEESDQALAAAEETAPRAKVAIEGGQVYLATSRVQAVSRLLDGQYPRYEQLIPQSNRIVATGNKQALIASLERAAVMANERTHIVRMTLDSGQLVLAADTPDVGNSKDMVPVRYDGEPLQIAFNYKYVLDALKVIESNDVRMETNGALAPTIFRADDESNYLCLVMPVQVK